VFDCHFRKHDDVYCDGNFRVGYCKNRCGGVVDHGQGYWFDMGKNGCLMVVCSAVHMEFGSTSSLGQIQKLFIVQWLQN